jgi:hypothetical protein
MFFPQKYQSMACTLGHSGTCWMKSGEVKKSDAFPNGNPGMVCGIVNMSMCSTSFQGCQIFLGSSYQNGKYIPKYHKISKYVAIK